MGRRRDCIVERVWALELSCPGFEFPLLKHCLTRRPWTNHLPSECHNILGRIIKWSNGDLIASPRGGKKVAVRKNPRHLFYFILNKSEFLSPSPFTLPQNSLKFNSHQVAAQHPFQHSVFYNIFSPWNACSKNKLLKYCSHLREFMLYSRIFHEREHINLQVSTQE